MIDAHQHLWRIGRNDCRWPPPGLAAIHRDFGPDDLRAVAEPLGVRGSVLVQSQESDRDTDYLLELAAREPFILAVVGWADLKAVDAPARVAHLAAQPKLRGLRPMLQGLAPDWIADPALAPAIKAMEAHRLVMDALVRPEHLAHLHAFALAHPGLQIVIDHAAKPPIAGGDLRGWRASLAPLARLPNLWCKLSGLLTEAGPRGAAASLAPCISDVMDLFGPERVLWGSDWPVVNLAGDYAGWLRLAEALLQHLDARARQEVFGGSAARLYGLNLV